MNDTRHPSAPGIAGALRNAGLEPALPLAGGTNWYSTGFQLSPEPGIPGGYRVVHRRRGQEKPAVLQAEVDGYAAVLAEAGFTVALDPECPRLYVTPPAPGGKR